MYLLNAINTRNKIHRSGGCTYMSSLFLRAKFHFPRRIIREKDYVHLISLRPAFIEALDAGYRNGELYITTL